MRMTAKIYNFSEHLKQKDTKLRLAYGYSEEVWDLIKENGYDVYDPEDIDQFFMDLEEG